MTTRKACRKLAIFRMRNPLWAAVAIALGLTLGTNVQAATITVDSLADTGAPGICVLRDAITAANTMTATNGCAAGDGNDTINFDITGTISLGSTLPEIADSNLTIFGPASPGITIKSGNDITAIVVASNATVAVYRLTITNVIGANASIFSAIYNYGTLTVTNSTISKNNWGIHNAGGTLTIINTTFSGNSPGGAISSGTTMTVTNSTFFNNGQPTLEGGAISSFAPMTVINSTFSGNKALLVILG
jgi:hypothetical protein